MCEKCNNTGWIEIEKGGTTYMQECSCMKQKYNLARLKNSGLDGLYDKYTFNRYKADYDFQKDIFDKAKRYTKETANKWFVIVGESGSGKTHICTAICKELIEQGREVKYMSWLETANELKQNALNKIDYQKIISDLKDIEVLYIDDFLKSNNKSEPTTADIKLANEILNYRYNKSMKSQYTRTIISSERLIKQLIEYDSAVAGRIVECANEYLTQVIGKEKNYRLREYY